MELKYLGLSGFKMRFKNGVSLLADPFDPKYVGLPLTKQRADLVTVSCKHKGHDFVAIASPVAREEIFVVDEEGEYEIGGIEVTAVEVSCGSNKNGSEALKAAGTKGAGNLAMVIRGDGLIICHLGNLGGVLTEKQVERIGSVDVLLVPVGGGDTLDASKASELVSNMAPSVVVPMHYKMKGMGPGLDTLKGVDEFLDKSGLEVMFDGADKFKIDANTLPENTKVAVLGH